MNLLALDTSTVRAAVALDRGGDRLVAPDPAPGAARHGRELLPAIAALLDRAGLRPRDLDAVAVGLGPGSYTGLRVGMTAAKTLAFALGKPLVGVDTFAAVARNAPPDASTVHVIADAQRGSLYVATYLREPGSPHPAGVGPIAVVDMAAWAAAVEPGSWVIGAGLDRLRVAWPDGVHVGSADQGHPSADALLDLGLAAVRAGAAVSPHAIEPAYLRRSAAEDQWDARG